MSFIRRHLAQRHVAMLVCAAALLLKLLVPAGYMVDAGDGRMTVKVCSATAPRTMTIAVPGLGGDTTDHGDRNDDGVETPCAFAGLSAAALSAVDPALLATLIAFVLAIGLVGVTLPIQTQQAHLRPPPIGPPTDI